MWASFFSHFLNSAWFGKLFNDTYSASFIRSKLFLMSWCPDTAKIKKKMIYSSSFDTLKKAFVGVHKVIQSNGPDELEQPYIEGILKSTDRK